MTEEDKAKILLKYLMAAHAFLGQMSSSEMRKCIDKEHPCSDYIKEEVKLWDPVSRILYNNGDVDYKKMQEIFKEV